MWLIGMCVLVSDVVVSLQDRLKQRRMAKEEEEKKEQIAREKARRTTNKELGMAKQK